MVVRSVDLIEDYYNSISDEYPHLSLDDIRSICFSPWKFLKDEMENGLLNEMRFKYVGVFQVYLGRAKIMLKWNEDRYKRNLLSEEEYTEYKEMLEKYINEKSKD